MGALDAPPVLGRGAFSIYSHSLATDLSMVSPAGIIFDSGTFTPQDSTAKIKVTVSGAYFGTGGGYGGGVGLLVGPTGLSGGLNALQQSVLKSGVSFYVIGALNGTDESISREIKLTGLTPGVPVAWELMGSVIGGEEIMVLPETPTRLASSGHGPLRLARFSRGDCFTLARCPSRLHIFRYNSMASPLIDEHIASFALEGTAGGCDITDDGKYAVVASTSDNSIRIVALDTMTSTRVVLPDAAAGPREVSCDPTWQGYFAWVTAANGKVYGVDMVGGTVSFFADLGATTSPTFVQAFESGYGGNHSWALVTCPGTNEVVLLASASGILHRFAVANVKDCAVPVNGIASGSFTKAYAVADHPTNGLTIFTINWHNTLNGGYTVDAGVRPFTNATPAHPVRAKIMPDLHAMLIACSNGDGTTSGSDQIIHVNVPNVSLRYTQWANLDPADSVTRRGPTGLALNDWGDIFITDTNSVNLYPGGLMVCRPSAGGFYNEGAWVIVEGAA